MKNQAFILRSTEDKQKKLYAVLRSRTDNALSEDELRIMSLCVEPERQYEIVLYHDPLAFCLALVLKMADKQQEQGRIVFGQAMFGWSGSHGFTLGRLFDEQRPAAAIIHPTAGDVYTIHIYVPASCLSKAVGR